MNTVREQKLISREPNRSDITLRLVELQRNSYTVFEINNDNSSEESYIDLLDGGSVEFHEANKLLNDTVQKKLTEGYDINNVEVNNILNTQGDTSLRASTILNYLKKVNENDFELYHTNKKNKKIILSSSNKRYRVASRVIFRAGELGLIESVPLLINLYNKLQDNNDKLTQNADKFVKYSIVWSLSRLSYKNLIPENHIQTVSEILSQESSGSDLLDSKQSTALAGYFYSLSESQKQDHIQNYLKQHQFNFLVENSKVINSDLDEFSKSDQDTTKFYSQLPALYIYLKSDETFQKFLRKVFIEFQTYNYQYKGRFASQDGRRLTVDTPFEPGKFHGVRKVLKLAELLEDHSTLGLIYYRIDTTKYFYKSTSYPAYIPGDGAESPYANAKEEYSKPNPRIAFSSKTKSYLQKRGWRTLRRYAEISDSKNYTDLASEILLHYDDSKDNYPSSSSSKYNYVYNSDTNRYESKTTYFDSMGKYFILYSIIYGKSLRYEYIPGTAGWRFKEPYKPDSNIDYQSLPREESYPDFWDNHPQNIIKILKFSKCLRVNDFAVKVFNALPEDKKNLDINDIVHLLKSQFKNTKNIGFELCKKHYDPSNPNIDLVIALLESGEDSIEQYGKSLIQDRKTFFFSNEEFVTKIATSGSIAVQSWAKEQLVSISLSEADRENVVNNVIRKFLTDNLNEECIKNASEILFIFFHDELDKVQLDTLSTFIDSRNTALQTFAGRIILNNKENAFLTDEIIQTYIKSESSNVRAIGVQMLNQLPDKALLGRSELLYKLLTSDIKDLRIEVRSVIKKLIVQNSEFTTDIILKLLNNLLYREKHKGLNKDIYIFLSEDLKEYLVNIDSSLAWNLVLAKGKWAQEIAATILKQNNYILDYSHIITLTSKESFALRSYAFEYIKRNFDKFRQEADLKELFKILDSKWDDARQFGIEFFAENLTESDWNSDTLIYICDSNREEIQEFGCKLVDKYFNSEDGKEYLTKFSQHPSKKIQAYAIKFLNEYASSDTQMISYLSQYFTTVLLTVNKARYAKEKIYEFLSSQIDHSYEASEIIMQILLKVSDNVLIKDRSNCILLMHKIYSLYPQLNQSMKIKHIETVN